MNIRVSVVVCSAVASLLSFAGSLAGTGFVAGLDQDKIEPMAPVDVAVESGVLANGEMIPLPVYADGSVASESECRWVVCPASQELLFSSGSDTSTVICPEGRLDCYTTGRMVVVNFETECGTQPGQANFLIIATRQADLARPETCRAVAIATGILHDGGVIPLPLYTDGTMAQESDCRWIVSPASQWLGLRTGSGPDDGWCYRGRADCYTEGRTVVANFESDCVDLAGQATYLIIGTRAATTQHPGLCSTLALQTGILPQGGAMPQPVFWDGSAATESNSWTIVSRASQQVGFRSGNGPEGLWCGEGRIDCYPERRTIVANFVSDCVAWPGQATFMAIAARPVYVSYAGSGVYDEATLGLPSIANNAPNPFNPLTTIKYDLPGAGPVRLSVFDVSGRLVRTLVDENMPQGGHEAVWDGRDAAGREVASGSYLARLSFDGRVATVRMGLVR